MLSLADPMIYAWLIRHISSLLSMSTHDIYISFYFMTRMKD